jgi:hypothetical protein
MPCRALSGLIFTPPPLEPFALTLIGSGPPNAPEHLEAKTLRTGQKKAIKPKDSICPVADRNIPARAYVTEEALWLKGPVLPLQACRTANPYR